MSETAAALKTKLKQLQAVQQWCLKSEAAPRINAMIDLARSEEGIPILPDQLDKDPWLLNCANGTLELKTGTLREYRREDYITKLCPLVFDPAATCPRWEQFLSEIFQENRELMAYVQRLLGCCLTGDVSEQNLWIFWGAGANGKSTLLNIVLEMLGTDYGIKAPVDFLMAKNGNEHPTARADLFHTRLVCCTESGEGRRLDEVLVKELTGSEPIRARRMRENYWEFYPTHKVVLCTNHKPAIKGTDHAIWRRVRLVPFQVTIADEKQDKHLLDKLRGELPGILAWCVRGCLAWQRDGLGLPDAVKVATTEYRSAQDLLGQFLAECCLTGSTEYRCRAGDLYVRLKAWCETGGEKAPTQKTFGDSLAERGFERFTSNGSWWRGVVLIQQDDVDGPMD